MSALPAIENHLLEVFTDALANEKTKVVYGYAEAPEIVALFGGEFDREFRLLGPQPVPLDESWTLEVIIEVIRPSGRDMKPAADRVWELFEIVEAALRKDIDLEGVTFDSRFQKGSREFFQTDKAQGCRIRTTIAGTARI